MKRLACTGLAIFPDRRDASGAFEVPKTLIFPKTDSHADDIINIVREEFGEGNAFCKKVTFGSDKGVNKIAFRPGTDERVVEEIKGRGTRTLDLDGLRKARAQPGSRKNPTRGRRRQLPPSRTIERHRF